MKKHITLIKYLFVIIFSQTVHSISAASAPGYIVTNNLDTIQGFINVPWFNAPSGSINFTGFSLNNYHWEVAFRQPGQYWYKKYSPKDIIGFSFMHKYQRYVFHRFVLNRKSIVKGERRQYRFWLYYN